jgi:hypothetical protein
MNTQEFLSRLQGVKKTKTGWTALCPAHGDKTASLSISTGDDGRILLKCFAGCDIQSIMGALGLQTTDLFNKESVCSSYPPVQGEQVSRLIQPPDNKENSADKTSAPPKTRFAQVRRLGCTLSEYSNAKKLPEDFLKSIGIGESTYRGQTKLVIPYFDEKGELVCNRYRLSMAGDKKFAWEKGAHPCLYGLWRLKNYLDDLMVVIEGESDLHTLWYNDIPAVALPGASMWKNERDAPYLKKFKAVYVVIEPDKGGEAVLRWISKSSIKQKVKLVTLPVKDVSDLYLDDPDTFTEKFDQALSQATPFVEYEQRQLRAQESETWQKCKDLAQSPNILDAVSEEVRGMGVTGEERIVKILFLAMVSRFLGRPISVAIKGPSSAGKSYILDAIVKLFPEDAYYLNTSMSDHALAYTEAEFKHRMILLAEASGLSSDFQSYLVRTLLSEGRIIYETVDKTKDGLKARRIEKEGPTGFICTTTSINLHPENETRMLSLTVNDTKEQTKAILMALADNHKSECKDPGKWHALQRWLETQTRDVEIPYVMKLAELIPPVAVRLRRDFTTLLNLIKSSAILHQVNRARNKNGEVVATIEDYRIVYELIYDLISEGVEATVSKAVREMVEAVKEIVAEKNYATTRDVANYLKIDRQAADRRLRQAARLNYLKNNNPGRGKTAQYVIGDSVPDDIQILPQPEILTCSPAQTCVNENEQVEQAESVDKTASSENMLTCSPETAGVSKHKHSTLEEIDYVPV